MKAFEYNPETLTQEQKDAIALAHKVYDERMKSLQAREEAVMEHYYDCLDEYSWGNPYMEKVQERERAMAWQTLQDKIEEIVRGGFLVRTRKANILRDIKTGQVAAIGTHEGMYGRYFILYQAFGPTKFISCAKKVSTYERKGFRPYIQEVVNKVRRSGCFADGSPRYDFIETLSISETVSTEIVY